MKQNRSLFLFLMVISVTSPSGADVETGRNERAFRFAVISDPQVRSGTHPWNEIFAGVLDELGGFSPRPGFVLCTGDMVDGRSGKNLACPAEVYHAQYEVFFRLLQNRLDPSILFYPVVGNHDYHRSNDGSASGPELYARYWFDRIPEGVSPRNSPYYSFDFGNVHFVILCTGLLGVKKVSDYEDLVYGDQYDWLKKDLETADSRPDIEHILVFGHHNFHPVRSKQPSDWKGLEVVRNRLWEDLFVRYGVRAYFHGHWHFYDRHVQSGNIPAICLGGLDGLETPLFPELRVNHYAIADVSGADILVSIFLPGGKLYDRFSLNDLSEGRIPPPQLCVRTE